METALKLAQASLNSRPLIAIRDGIEDVNILTLSPAHSVLGRALITLPTAFDKLETNALNEIPVRSRWEKRKKSSEAILSTLAE